MSLKMVDLESLFQTRESEDEIIYFNDIMIDTSKMTDGLDSCSFSSTSTVRFNYSYCDEVEFHSSFLIDGSLDKTNFHVIFSIGMCILPWYWMAFGTANIVIRENAAKFITCNKEELNDILTFWKNFYNELFLEFFYVNGISKSRIELMIQKITWEELKSPPSFHYREEVLIPLGGKVSEIDSIIIKANPFVIIKVVRTVWWHCIYLYKKGCYHSSFTSLMAILNTKIVGD